MNQFEGTEVGYIKAKRWLIENNLYPSCIKYELSTDGWTLIACANDLWEKMNDRNDSTDNG